MSIFIITERYRHFGLTFNFQLPYSSLLLYNISKRIKLKNILLQGFQPEILVKKPFKSLK